jgi:hypothetical protein
MYNIGFEGKLPAISTNIRQDCKGLMDKHSSIPGSLIICGCKKFYNINSKKAGKTCQGQTLQLIINIGNLLL